MPDTHYDIAETKAHPRPLKPALMNGLRCRCPNCGQGPVFRGYLKVRDDCAVCGEELFHHRADDGPAYLTILIVGHIMAPAIIWIYSTFRPEPLVLATGLTIATVALSLFLLPRLKGGIIAFQWSRMMGGFDPDR